MQSVFKGLDKQIAGRISKSTGKHFKNMLKMKSVTRARKKQYLRNAEEKTVAV